jgi:putative membrane protein
VNAAITPRKGVSIMGKRIIIAVLSAGCACTTMVYAAPGTLTKVSPAARKFMDKAAQGGLAEVQLGQLAEQKASSQAVKDFGQRMVTDHTKVNDQLKSLASSDGVALPTAMNAKDQALYDKLSGMSGPAFDQEYMKNMVKDHKMDIADFQKESNSGRNEGVKMFASSTLPTLQQHLQLAQSVDSKIGASASR